MILRQFINQVSWFSEKAIVWIIGNKSDGFGFHSKRYLIDWIY